MKECMSPCYGKIKQFCVIYVMAYQGLKIS